VSVFARRPTVLFAAAVTLLLSNATRAQGLTVTALTPSVGYPLVGGTPVTWTATVSGALGSVEYKFFMYQRTSWVLMQDYGSSNVFAWTPQAADAGTPNNVQVWARAVGSTAAYDSYFTTPSFDVSPPPIAMTASVDFPTPPGNTVTWTASTSVVTTPEYEFRVLDQSTSTWSVFRAYGTSGQAQWTPQTAGNYVVQVRARTVGTSVDYDKAVSTPTLNVSASTALTVTSFGTATAFPAATGTPITWTARAKGGSAGPLEYTFWRVLGQTWTNVQAYGASPTYTWAPTWADAGEYSLQVWVRNAGSTASYDAWRSTDTTFQINRASVQLTTTTQFPTYAKLPIVWTAHVPDSSVTFQYQFWVYSSQTNQWTLGRDYAASETFTWTPLAAGNYRIQAWARQTGSTASYEVYSGTDLLEITNPVITATPAGGAYNTAQTVALQGPTGTTVRYTTNGSAPTSNSPVYTGPIAVTTSITLRAKTFQGTSIDNYELIENYVIDSVAPVITTTLNPPPNPAGWNRSPVRVEFSCADLESGVASCPSPVLFDTNGANQSITVTASDAAGNQATKTVTVNLDKTPSSVAITAPAEGVEVSSTSVTVSATVSDNLSGVQQATCNGTTATIASGFATCVVQIQNGRNTIVVQVSDVAGNSSSAAVTAVKNGVATSLVATPSRYTLAIGETIAVTIADNVGRAVTVDTWSSGDAAIATVDAAGAINAVSGGQTTITATAGALSTQVSVNVLAVGSLPVGTQRWSVDPLPGYEVTGLVGVGPTEDSTTFVQFEHSLSGSGTLLRGFNSAGEQTYVVSPPAGAGDFVGGSMGSASGSLLLSSSVGLIHFDPSSSGNTWGYKPQASIMRMAQGPDDTVYLLLTQQDATPPPGYSESIRASIVVLDGRTGTVKADIPIPQSNSRAETCPYQFQGVAQSHPFTNTSSTFITVDAQGRANVAVLVTDIHVDRSATPPAPCALTTTGSARVDLYTVQSSGAYTMTTLQAATAVNLSLNIDLKVLADELGGVLVTSRCFNAGTGDCFPLRGMYVLDGAVAGYPLSPTTFMAVSGSGRIAYARDTSTPKISAFDIPTGSPNWAVNGLSYVSAALDGGDVAASAPDGTITIVNSSGTPIATGLPAVNLSGNLSVDSVGNLWLGQFGSPTLTAVVARNTAVDSLAGSPLFTGNRGNQSAPPAYPTLSHFVTRDLGQPTTPFTAEQYKQYVVGLSIFEPVALRGIPQFRLKSEAKEAAFLREVKNRLNSAVAFIGDSVTYAGVGSVGLQFTDKGIVKPHTNPTYLDPRGSAFTDPLDQLSTSVKVVFVAACETADTFKSLWDITQNTADRALIVPIAKEITPVDIYAGAMAWSVIETSLTNDGSGRRGKSVYDAVRDGNTYLEQNGQALRFQVIGGNEGRNVRIR
jgi:Chitobiase/beta-hexosaminidase C-terminal domain/Glucodextranase, domain B/Bacterial Ig-like domain (group 2)